MSCTVIICQALDHQLVSGGDMCSIRSVTIDAVSVQLATYPRCDDDWVEEEEDWMAAHVAAIVARSAANDLILVADHDSVGRFSNDGRVIRAEYSVGQHQLGLALDRTLRGDRQSLDEVLTWFWTHSLELPAAGLYSLSNVINRGGPIDSKWTTVRDVSSYRRALRWLPVFNPACSDDPGLALVRTLVEQRAPVALDQHVRCQHWLGQVDVPDAQPFVQFCQQHLTQNAS